MFSVIQIYNLFFEINLNKRAQLNKKTAFEYLGIFFQYIQLKEPIW